MTKLLDMDREAIVMLFQQGSTAYEIASGNGYALSTVYRVLRDAGATSEEFLVIDPEVAKSEWEAICAIEADKLTPREIQSKTGVTSTRFWQLVKECGLPKPTKGQKNYDEIAVTMYIHGQKLSEIKKVAGIHPVRLYELLDAAGVPRRRDQKEGK